MAVTKLLRMKEADGKNKAAHLKHNIYYICNPEKTEGGLYISSNAGVSPETIFRAMVRNKEFWNKPDKSQGFHYMLSFAPDSGVDENLALQIAEEFCQELLQGRFYYVCAVHNDRPHMHVHITFDSVSKEDGYKFHSPKGDWERRIQPITDRLSRKYGLPELVYDAERKGVHYGKWEKRSAGKKDTEWKTAYEWDDILREDIDEAIAHSDSMEDFFRYLREQKYVIRDGAYLSLRPYGKPQARRTSRLGPGYGKEEIAKRIADNAVTPQIEKRYRTYGDWSAMQAVIFAKVKITPGWRMSPFLRQFYRRWNNTVFLRRPGAAQPWKYKKELLEIGKLSDAIRYMMDHDIGSLQDLQERMENLKAERDAARRKLQAARTKLYRSSSAETEEKTAMQEQAQKYSGLLQQVKKEINLAEYISRKFYEMETEEKMHFQDTDIRQDKSNRQEKYPDEKTRRRKASERQTPQK